MSILVRKKHLLALSITAALLTAPSVSLFAAEEVEEVERIEVTGSHITRNDMAGPFPLTSLSAKDIENAGVTDLIGLFTKLPISGQG